MLLSIASRLFDSNRYMMAGGMRHSIPPRRRKRSKLKCPTSEPIAMLGFGPLRAISLTPQKNTPAKITPAMTQTPFLVTFLKSPEIAPPPSPFSFSPLPDLVATPGPAVGAGWGWFGLDIFILLTFRLHSVEYEEEHYSADRYEYEGHEVHEREYV